MTTCPHTLGANGLACTLAAGHTYGHVFIATAGPDLSTKEGGGDE